jgi:putative transposase
MRVERLKRTSRHHEREAHPRTNRQDSQAHRAWQPSRRRCRAHNISEQSYYRRKRKYGGKKPNEAKRTKDLEGEIQQLKPPVDDRPLGIQTLKEVNSKKWQARCSATHGQARGGHVGAGDQARSNFHRRSKVSALRKACAATRTLRPEATPRRRVGHNAGLGGTTSRGLNAIGAPQRSVQTQGWTLGITDFDLTWSSLT